MCYNMDPDLGLCSPCIRAQSYKAKAHMCSVVLADMLFVVVVWLEATETCNSLVN